MYNSYVQYDLTWKGSMFWVVLILAVSGGLLNSLGAVSGLGGLFRAIAGIMAFAAFVIEYILANHKLARSFGHGAGFTIGLLFLESIFMLILGFGSSEYIGNTAE